jgi:hypothetical protein
MMSGDSDYLEPLMVNHGNLPEKEKDKNKSDVGFFSYESFKDLLTLFTLGIINRRSFIT